MFVLMDGLHFSSGNLENEIKSWGKFSYSEVLIFSLLVLNGPVEV